MRAWNHGGPLQLQVVLLKNKPAVLALDVYNIISLEIIQNPDCLTQEPNVLESLFLERKQLCIDVQISDILNHNSLEETLQGFNIEEIPEEFPLALLWDQSPSSPAILDVLLKLTGEVNINIGDRTSRVHMASLIISRGMFSLCMTPGQSGGVVLNSKGLKIEMRTEELIMFAIQWELKPDMAFLAKAGPVFFERIDEGKRKELDEMGNITENIILEAPVPSVIIQGDNEEGGESLETGLPTSQQPEADDGRNEDRLDEEVFNASPGMDAGLEEPLEEQQWQCRGCGQMNPEYNTSCSLCLEFKTSEQDAAPPATSPTAQVEERQLPPRAAVETVPKPQKIEAQKTTWICRFCTAENPESTKICEGCAKSNRPVQLREEEPEHKKEMKPGQWECTTCTLINSAKDRICGACAKTRKELLPPSPPSEEDDKVEVPTFGFWECEKCHYSANSQSDLKCFRCKADKYTSNGGKSTVDTSKTSEITKGTLKPTKGGETEDWICRKCNERNFSWKSKCRRCDEPKEPVPEAVETGQWTCAKCGTVNSQIRNYCNGNRCFERKPDPPDAKPHTREQPKAVPRIDLEVAINEKAGTRDPGAAEERRNPRDSVPSKQETKTSSALTEDLAAFEYKFREDRNKFREHETQPAERRYQLQDPERKPSKREDEKEQVPTTPQTSDKEWICPKCRNQNRKTYTTCLFCDGPKPQESSPAVTSKYGSWKCGECDTVNFYYDDECRKCHSKPTNTKPSPEHNVSIEETWNCSTCDTLNSREATKCRLCKAVKKPNSDSMDRKQEGWVCGYCQHANKSTAITCSECCQRKHADISASHEQAWYCPHCTRKNTGPKADCEFCFRSSAVPSKPYQKEVSGKCETCGRAVIGSSPLCDSCQAPRPTPPDSTWKCKKCSNVNRADRRECRFCKAAIETVSRPQTITGRCSKCGSITAATEGLCVSCRVKIPNPSSTWRCSSCRTENTRSICTKCYKQKPYSRP